MGIAAARLVGFVCLTLAGACFAAEPRLARFTAYDAGTGESLWSMRLSDIPNAAPMTYLANGKQYVAVVVGVGHFGQALNFPPLMPEIQLPLVPSSALWVFELPEERSNT